MKDQLSALIDGEFEIESSQHIIKSIESGGELKEAWHHYHLIRYRQLPQTIFRRSVQQGWRYKDFVRMNHHPTSY